MRQNDESFLGKAAKENQVINRHRFKRTNSDFLIPVSQQPDGVNLQYFKLSLCDLKEFIVWNIKDLPHWIAKIFRKSEFLCNKSVNRKELRFATNSNAN